MLAKILQGKARMQLVVQEMVALRAAAKGQRASSLAGAASSVGGAAASGSLAGTGGGRTARDPERALQERMAEVAGVLRHDVSKPEEGAWGCCCRRWVCHLAACLGPPADCSLGRFAQCSAWALPPACRPQACSASWSRRTTTCSGDWPRWPPLAAPTRTRWRVSAASLSASRC